MFRLEHGVSAGATKMIVKKLYALLTDIIIHFNIIKTVSSLRLFEGLFELLILVIVISK